MLCKLYSACGLFTSNAVSVVLRCIHVDEEIIDVTGNEWLHYFSHHMHVPLLLKIHVTWSTTAPLYLFELLLMWHHWAGWLKKDTSCHFCNRPASWLALHCGWGKAPFQREQGQFLSWASGYRWDQTCCFPVTGPTDSCAPWEHWLFLI